MKILYCGQFNFPDKNPACLRALSIARMLYKQNCNVTFFTYSNNVKYYQEECIENKFLCKYIPIDSGLDKVRFYLDSKSIINELKSNNYDAIILYNYPSIAYKKIMRYCRNNNIKIVADLTEWYDNEVNKFIRVVKNYDTKTRMENLNKNVDGIIAVSRYLEKYYDKFVTNIVTIPTFVPMDKIPTASIDGNIKVVFIGNVGKNFSKERLDIVINAFANCNVDNIDFTIIGVSEEAINQRCNKISRRISILGKIPHNECLDILSKADFSIIPREKKINTNAGFPTKLSESFCSGTAVIATDTSDIKDYIVEGKNGYLLSECTEEEFVKVFEKISQLTIEDRYQMKKNAVDMNKLVAETFEDDIKIFMDNLIK